LFSRETSAVSVWIDTKRNLNMSVSPHKQLISIVLLLLVSGILLFRPGQAAAKDGEIRVAVATNFIRTIEKLASRYEAETGSRLKLSAGATGMLYAQILNYAPYDLFLAADEKRPALLHEKELCETPFTYATGRVVLWSARKDLNQKENWRQVVSRDDIARIAIANPETAPYGEAALAAMRKTGLEQGLQNRLVYGQNVGQAFQYGQQGVVDLAFVAQSFALSEHGRKGKTWLLSEALPVDQMGCILKDSPHKALASNFVAYLHTDRSKTLLSELGYK